jgi:antitoxin (DNA-binding transcriptional repressor) of toxin-antitoxin stability system
MGTGMKKMSTRTFKAQCLSVVSKVHATGEPVSITKCGQPFVKLLPAKKKADNIFGCLQGVIKIVGDIESPVVPPEDLEALR